MRDNYSAWGVKLSDFPEDGTIEEKIMFFTRFGILAANIHNTQPWLFSIRKNVLTIAPNVAYQLTAGDPSGHNMYITIGCGIANLECIAAYFGYELQLQYKKEVKKLEVFLTFLPIKKSDKDLSALASSITKRYSNKLPYSSKAVSRSIIGKLKNLSLEGLSLTFVDDKEKKLLIAKLQGQAVKNVASKDFTRELSYWVTANNSTRGDGMPGYVEGFSSVKAVVGKYLLRFYPKIIVNTLAKKNVEIIDKGALVGVISSELIDKKIAINVGRLYQRVALSAFSMNIHCTPMHAIIEDKDGSSGLKTLLGLNSLTPRFMFRMGYSDAKPYHTPRRDIKTFYT